MSRSSLLFTLPRRLGTGLLIALAAACLSGCGQKGPLYLPDDESAAGTPTEADTPAAADQD